MTVPIIAVVGGLNMDMIFETERMPDLGESMDSTTLDNLHGGKGGNTAVAVYRASHVNPEGSAIIKERSRLRRDQRNIASDDEAHRWNIDVHMNGAVGDDEFGEALKEKLEQTGIDTSGVIIVKGERSGTCAVIVEQDTGESRNLAYQGANLKWTLPQHDSVKFLGGGTNPDLIIAHLGIRREQVEKLLEKAGRSGVEVVLNPSPAVFLLEPIYKNVTHLIMNETESAMLSGRSIEEFNNRQAWEKAAEEFIQKGVENVVITLGAKGAYFATREGENGLVDAEQDVKVKDSTGAGYVAFDLPFPTLPKSQHRGSPRLTMQCPKTNVQLDCRDTFVGNYSVEYVNQKHSKEWDIRKAIAIACKASAYTIQRLGCQESIPWADQIDRPKIVRR